MSLPNPIPIALCGKNQTMANSFGSSIEKDGYKVTHHCKDVESAKSELPSLISSETGPLAVVIGKGFSEEEMQDIIDHCKGHNAKTAWLLPSDEKFTAFMKAKAIMSAGTMLPTVIADRAIISLKERGIAPGNSVDGYEGGVFDF